MSDIKDFTKEKIVDFPEELELADRITDLVLEYTEMSIMAVIGILDTVKDRIKADYE